MNTDQILGMLVGAAVGDAIELPHQLDAHQKNVYTGLIECWPSVKLRKGYKLFAFGSVGDNTESIITLVQSLIDKGAYYRDYTITKYMEWSNNGGPPLVGKHTRSLFHGIKTMKQFWKRFKMGQLMLPQQSNNDAMVRCCVMAAMNHDQMREWSIVQDCNLTNPSLIAQECCKLLVHLIRQLCIDITYDRQPIRVKSSIPEIKQAVRNDIGALSKDNDDECVSTLCYAMYCLRKFEKLEEALDWLFLSPSDVKPPQATACVVGAILGAKRGFRRLMTEERTRKNWEIIQKCDTQKSDVFRPLEYHPKQLPDLAVQLHEALAFMSTNKEEEEDNM